ncbi:MAG: HAD family hydrolase [Chloroflexota bacterium]|nr:HAD family hydrolase [Chloroflexota bacterium]
MRSNLSDTQAVVLDVGGVLLVPHAEPLAAALAGLGVPVGPSSVVRAHYVGVRALDEAPTPGDAPSRYLDAYTRALGVPDALLQRATSVLHHLWVGPSPQLWRHPVPGSLDRLRRLAESGHQLAVVSNSDGTVEALLTAHRICQIGAGAGVPVCAIVDSAIVGVAKPDPRIFHALAEQVGIIPERAVYVGDTVRYDVLGARAAGLHPLLFDPYDLCASHDDHAHVRSLDDVVDLLGRRSP